jgi:hypothetical protein
MSHFTVAKKDTQLGCQDARVKRAPRSQQAARQASSLTLATAIAVYQGQLERVCSD